MCQRNYQVEAVVISLPFLYRFKRQVFFPFQKYHSQFKMNYFQKIITSLITLFHLHLLDDGLRFLFSSPSGEIISYFIFKKSTFLQFKDRHILFIFLFGATRRNLLLFSSPKAKWIIDLLNWIVLSGKQKDFLKMK